MGRVSTFPGTVYAPGWVIWTIKTPSTEQAAEGVQDTEVWCKMIYKPAAGAFSGGLVGRIGGCNPIRLFFIGSNLYKQSESHAKAQLD